MKQTVVIADDHVLIAKALASIISDFSGYEVLYEVEHGQALIERFRQPRNIPDILLLDISMPVMDGFETAKWLKQQHPAVLILALSMQDDEQTLIKMIKAGAHGYLLKNAHPSELEKALAHLVEKGFYYSDWATSKVLHSISDEDSRKPGPVKLNDRETDFLQYACTELTYKEIAEKMFCSPRTVEGYRDALFEKLNIKTRVGLVVFAIKNGYVRL
jgi:DNA-binding NarL/FixJ family response regulator